MTAKAVAAQLRKLGIPVLGYAEADWDGLSDGEVDVTSKVHVQVGADYLIVVKCTPKGEFQFFNERRTVKDLLPDLRESGVV